MTLFIKHIVLIGFLISCSCISRAQHVMVYGHYLSDPIVLNPAFTGYDKVPVIGVSYRNQWVGLDGAPNSQIMTYHMRLRDKKNSLGFVAFRDKIGVTSSYSFMFNYAHKYKLSRKTFLSLGASGGIKTQYNDWSSVNTTDNQDQVFQSNTGTGLAPNFGFGANYYSNNFFISLSIPSLLTHTQTGPDIKVSHRFKNYNYLLGGGYSYKLNREFALGSSVLLKYLVSSPVQLDLTLYTKYKDQIKFGLSWRSKDALSVILGYQVNEQLSFGYQYDFTLSALNTFSNGSHDINLRYTFGYSLNTTNTKFF